jgi:DNA-binding transcriptional MocR family regulator
MTLAAAEFAAGIGDRSASGIAGALHRLINKGSIAPGDRLPTVRELASALGTSPATVAEAWRALAATGAIVARGRAGTFVTDRARWASRYNQMTSPSAGGTELSTGVPDPALLPDLGPALARVAHRAATTSYVDEPVLPELSAWLRSSWPYAVPALTVVDGALDAIDRVLRLTVRLGDHVAVEHPTFPPFLDMLETLGAVVVPVDVDADGPRPASLAAALRQEPVAFVYQPRAQNPTGASLTQARAKALARTLRRHEIVIIEDNHSGSIARADDISLGAWLPDQTVHVRSYSKSHGPDLRIAALGGPEGLVAEVQAGRQLGPGWTSRLLQGVLLDMLTDGATVATVAKARDLYAARRDQLAAALAGFGVRVPAGDGLAMWIPVTDERRAVVTLAAAGIGVSPGLPFCARTSSGAHIRITLGNLPDDAPSVQEVARLLALAARPARR